MTTIQSLRHDAQEAASSARHALNPSYKVRTDVTDDPASEARDTLRVLAYSLKGVQGFTKEQQIERLTEVKGTATELRATAATLLDGYEEALTAALQEQIAQVPAVVAAAKAKAAEALDTLEATLSEAAVLAETRDFDAHQAEKDDRRKADAAYDDSGEEDDEDDDF